MFKKVNPKQSFPEVEKEMLKYWEKNKIFEKSVKNREGGEKYVFFDGPPFANGLPHYGHMLANVIKDAVTRYWSMKGYYVPRRNGWDCHGLPVEYEIEKELELNGRKDVVDYGVENFNKKCRESVFRYTKEWEETLKRLARWVDFSDNYATLDNTYMETIWWIFKQIWDKKLVYTGHKAMHVCPRCETPLSNFEVSQGYKDVTDLSVTTKYKLKEDALKALGTKEKDVYVLAWTTTPWTLPGNVALALGEKVEYIMVAGKDSEDNEGVFILAKELADSVFGEGNYVEIEKVDPKKLVGTHYEPLFDYYVGQDMGGELYVIDLADFVTTEDGTGVVHIAPMFGEDDYQFGLEKKLGKVQHVKMNGTFTEDVTDFAGRFVKGQDLNVAIYLHGKGLLFSKQNYKHSYPHCWRCETPLLNYATRSFFIEVTKLKDKMLKTNKEIHWQPEHIQEGRFGKWLEGARDWAISRNRFWGCAIPVWECECGEQICIGSVDELKEKAGKLPERDGKLDLHKPYIDDIKFKCTTCSGEMKRVPDVFDCWFESGAMPYAQLHYPFENKEKFESNFPAHFIAEGLDQTRGWFYTLHVLAAVLFDKPAFKNVIVNGIILAADGEKLSKRKKNYPDPKELFNSKGVDSMRYFLLSSPAALADDVRFSETHVEEIVKKFTLTLWNTYSFFVTYANIDKFEPSKDYKAFQPVHKLDRWILSELNLLIKDVTEQMDNYNLPKSTRPMLDFLENLSNWYVRRSRRRFWKSENDKDKDQAYQTLYIVLVEFVKILAPFMPYIADEIYQNLTTAKVGQESVHLADWPKPNEMIIDEKMNEEIHAVRTIVNLGHSVRAKARIKVRQPLQKVGIALPEGLSKEVIDTHKEVIMEELNVKELEFIAEAGDIVEHSVIPNAKVLGPKYGKDVQFIIQKVKAGEYELGDNSVKVGEFELMGDEVEIGFKGKEGYDVESAEGIVVALDTEISEDLKKEGYARDVVRMIQELRKEADYQVDDRIYVSVESGGAVDEAVTKFADYIKTETLADELQQSGDIEWDKGREVTFDDIPVKIAVRKV